jgi:broad specificity phosphatase PhoE
VVVWGIRHGQSEENERMHASTGNEWGDPTYRDDVTLRDTILSAKGKSQCESLSTKFRDLSADLPNLSEVDVILVSPLRRCLQTYFYSLAPALERLFPDGNGPRIIVQPLATERVYTVSDIGSSVHAEDVLNDFKKLIQADSGSYYTSPDLWDWSLLPQKATDGSQTPWWFTVDKTTTDYEEWRPHGEGQWYAVPGEPSDAFASRMRRFIQWILGHKQPRSTGQQATNHTKPCEPQSPRLDVGDCETYLNTNGTCHLSHPECRQVVVVCHWGVLGYLGVFEKYHHQLNEVDIESESLMFDVPNCGIARFEFPATEPR